MMEKMMERCSKFYVTKTVDTELEIRVTARDYNGIDSDPKVIERVPEFEELKEALSAVSIGDFKLVSDLDFPVQEMGGAA